MDKKEQTYRALIVAARTAATFVVAGWLAIALLGMYEWKMMLNWNATAFLAFLGYGVFILLPISRLPAKVFVPTVAIGAIIAIGSILLSMLFYLDMVEGTLDGAMQFRVLAWLLLIPIYAYIPIVILSRKYGAANKASQTIGSETSPQSGR